MADLDMRIIERGARDALHIGLGLFHTVRDSVHSVEQNLTSTYSELVTRGAAEQSGTAVQLRGILDESLERVRAGHRAG